MRRRRVVFAGLVLLLAATLAVGTGADTVTYDEVETLEIEPEGEYVFENEEQGEIRIQIGGESGAVDGQGVNRNAITDLGPVFTIENTLRLGLAPDGEPTLNNMTVWIDDESDAITFYDASAGDDDTIDSAGNGITLSPDETVTVGMRVDTTSTNAGTVTLTETITVVADVNEETAFDINYQVGDETFEADGGSTPPFDIAPGESVDVSAVAVTESGAERNLTEELTITPESSDIASAGNEVTAAEDAAGETVPVELALGGEAQSQNVEFNIQNDAPGSSDDSSPTTAEDSIDEEPNGDDSDSTDRGDDGTTNIDGDNTVDDGDDTTNGDNDATADTVDSNDDRNAEAGAGATGGDDSLFPAELGGFTLLSPWFLFTLAAASLLLLFAYRRRDDEDEGGNA